MGKTYTEVDQCLMKSSGKLKLAVGMRDEYCFCGIFPILPGWLVGMLSHRLDSLPLADVITVDGITFDSGPEDPAAMYPLL